MNWAFGDDLNTDYYAIKIDRLPTGMTAEAFYSVVRKHFAEFMNTDIAELEPNLDFSSSKLWNSDDPTGAIMVFHALEDDAAVLTTQARETSWIFTPAGTALDLEHPLAGHRQFGLVANEDGSHSFFTRGVDMMWDIEDKFIGVDAYGLVDKGFFQTADYLWRSVMQNVAGYVNRHGGNAHTTHSFTRRIPWSNIKPVDR